MRQQRIMKKMTAVYKKDLKAYFLSPAAYVLTGLFLMLSGLFFYLSTIAANPPVATMEYAFGNMIFILLLIIPILTMRLIAEEKKAGTDQLLFTSPIRTTSIVFGKFLAALTVYVLMLGITLVYPMILYYFAKIDIAPIISGYLGMLLIGGSFIAVGLFSSSITENQIISAIVSFTISLLFFAVEWLSSTFQGTAARVLEFLSIVKRFFNTFEVGILDLSDIVFYLSFILIFMVLTIRVLEERKVKG